MLTIILIYWHLTGNSQSFYHYSDRRSIIIVSAEVLSKITNWIVFYIWVWIQRKNVNTTTKTNQDNVKDQKLTFGFNGIFSCLALHRMLLLFRTNILKSAIIINLAIWNTVLKLVWLFWNLITKIVTDDHTDWTASINGYIMLYQYCLFCTEQLMSQLQNFKIESSHYKLA